MIFETDEYRVYHSVRDDFWDLIGAALKPDEKPAVAALGPIYETDPAAATLAPFVRSAQEAGFDPASMKNLAPDWVLGAAQTVREGKFSLWGLQASEQDWRDVHDWTKAGLVLQLSSDLGFTLKGGVWVHVKWKLKGTVTGRFGVEHGSWNPMTIPERDRHRIIPHAQGRQIAVLDFVAMDACSIVSLVPALRDRYADSADLHARTAELVGIDREEAKKELFVFAYGGRSRYEDRFIRSMPELVPIKGPDFARKVQETSALAFRAGLANILPLLCGGVYRPMFTVHDELVLDVSHTEVLHAIAEMMAEGASSRIGRQYRVGVKIGADYAEAKRP